MALMAYGTEAANLFSMLELKKLCCYEAVDCWLVKFSTKEKWWMISCVEVWTLTELLLTRFNSDLLSLMSPAESGPRVRPHGSENWPVYHEDNDDVLQQLTPLHLSRSHCTWWSLVKSRFLSSHWLGRPRDKSRTGTESCFLIMPAGNDDNLKM